MRIAILLVVVLSACGTSKPSEAELIAKERTQAEAACKKGDGPSCFVAGMGLDYMDQKQIEHAVELWTRGCALNHAACCGQLGTTAEFGMTSHGAKSDRQTAAVYYNKACYLGDKKSCEAMKTLFAY